MLSCVTDVYDEGKGGETGGGIPFPGRLGHSPANLVFPRRSLCPSTALHQGPWWLGEEKGGEKVHGSILGVLKGLTPRWLGEEEGGEKVHGSISGVLKGLTPRWLIDKNS